MRCKFRWIRLSTRISVLVLVSLAMIGIADSSFAGTTRANARALAPQSWATQGRLSATDCTPVVSGDRAGENGTTHAMSYDGNTATFFDSTHDNWQTIQIDFNCVGTFSALRRYMTRDGTDISGHRGLQGEAVSYSLDGTNWTFLTDTTNGWESYVNYSGGDAWHSVVYGWSAWLNLNTPAQARYVRFRWDDNFDAVNEIEIAFAEIPSPVTAPKWLAAPKLDGQCNDPAYVEAEAGTLTMRDVSGESTTQVRLLHSALDLYLCFDAMPVTTDQGDAAHGVAVRVDSDHSRNTQVMAGDYAFSVTAGGVLSVTQGSAAGTFVPLTVPADDFAAAVSSTGETWNAELRISLEWLGGYARTAGLNLSLALKDGTVLQQWPPAANPLSPATWGDLVLAPRYPATVSAGSAFLDGREGYLVVPYAPDLNPKEITIEAWVRVVDDDCGTLVGNGQAVSYWLGLCQVIQFGHGGQTSVRSGQHPLGEGWHHVAVTMDAEGVRTLYLDGQVELQPGWEPPHEEEADERGQREKVTLGISDRMLRIGSDRDALDDYDHLHGYVRELRIWNRARSADEIRETAFVSLAGNEPGLVALWPFTDGLQDVAGGHDAGLIGNASLAREAPAVTRFPDPPAYAPYDYPKPPPIPPWDAIIPLTSAGITLDGECQLSEYAQAARLVLEPDRDLHMKALLTPEALYLCTNVLFGSDANARDAVTFWIDRRGVGGPGPASEHLRLRLTPDGQVVAGTGDGEGFGGPAPEGITGKTVMAPRFTFQEDLKTLNAPWWASEVRIPLAALTPFKPGDPLRFAVRYEGTLPANASPGQPEDVAIGESWPADFDELQPDTWGKVTIEELSSGVTTESRTAPGSAGAVSPLSHRTWHVDRTRLSSFLAREAANPPPAPPTKQDFEARCSGGVFGLAYAEDKHAKWPLVDESRPVVQVEGVLTKVYVSPQDSPYIHDSHDLDMNMTLRANDRWSSLHTDKHTRVTVSGGPKWQALLGSAAPNCGCSALPGR